MTTNSVKKRQIKYLAKDFEGFKRDLIEHLRVYFPEDFQDFNESSIGMIQTEIAAFVGDNLSYYLDRKFDESFIETAKRRESIFKHAKQLGFKPFGKAAAVGDVEGFLKVPAARLNEEIIPDMRFAGVIKRGAKLKSKSGITYETLEDADFSEVDISDNSLVAVGDRNPTTNEPLNFVLKKVGVKVKAGETKTASFSVGSYEAFREIELGDEDVLEVLKVTDSDGNEWFEVDFLAQDTIFSGVPNTSSDSEDVPFILKLRPVPYRFISDFNVATSKTKLTFGSGDAQFFDGELIPDLGELALPLYGKDTFTDFFLDPQNFLKTRTLGLAPVNTNITVSYRVGGGADTNAGTGEINSVASKTFDIGDSSLNANKIKEVGNSFEVINTSPVQGGRDELSVEEVRHLIPAFFASQGRMVSAQDFVARALSMPSKFGSVFRASSRVNPLNKEAVELIVLSRDSNGFVTVAPADLKENLKKYLSRFRMVTDGIEILDGEVIDLALNFDLLVEPEFNKQEVIANCIDSLKEFFDVVKWQINQPVNLTRVRSLLSNVPGVLSIVDLQFLNRVGNFDDRSYSSTVYNIRENTQNGIIYCKENAIFQVKYPNKDIVGTAK